MSNWELAEFSIIAGQEEAFARQVAETTWLVQEFSGCRELQVHRAVDVDSRFVLVVEWDSVEVHREFVATKAFTRFFDPLRPFLASPVRVFHTEVVAGGFRSPVAR